MGRMLGRLAAVGLALLAAAGGVFLIAAMVRPRARPAVEILLKELVDNPYLEGEAVIATAQLANLSEAPVEIKAYHASCGCTEIRFPFGLPHRVPSKSVVPFQIVIDTAAQAGARAFVVHVIYQDATGQDRMASVAVPIRILPGLRVRPPSIVFSDCVPGERRSCMLTVLDGFPGDGIQMEGLKVSSSSQLVTSVRKVGRPDIVVETAEGELRERYIVHVECPVGARPDVQAHEIRLTAGTRSIQLPVLCRLAAPAYRLVPESLVVRVGSAGGNEYREVRCIGRDKDDWRIEVAECPAYITVVTTELDHQTKKIRLSIDTRLAASATRTKIVFRVIGKTSTELSLPVVFEGS